MDDASSLLLRGIPYAQDDLLELLIKSDTDYCSKLKEVEEKRIAKANSIEADIFTVTLSYVLGAAKFCLTDTDCLVDCLLFLGLATQKYKHFANYLYWKTGKRLLNLASTASNKNEILAAASS